MRRPTPISGPRSGSATMRTPAAAPGSRPTAPQQRARPAALERPLAGGSGDGARGLEVEARRPPGPGRAGARASRGGRPPGPARARRPRGSGSWARATRGRRGSSPPAPTTQARTGLAASRVAASSASRRARGIAGAELDVQDEHRIDVLVLEQSGDRLEVVGHRRAHAEVDRVAEAIGAGQGRGQPRPRRLAGRRELEAARRAGVGRHHAEAAGVRHHADPAPVRAAAGARAARRRRTASASSRRAARPAWRKSASVAASSSTRPRAALDREDRLAPRDAPGDLREAPRVAEGLHVERDDGRALVVGPVLEQVVGRHVGAVAQRDEGRDAQAARRRVAEQRQAERARLRRQGQGARGHADAADERVQAQRPASVLTTPSALGPTSRSPWARTASRTAVLALATLGLVAVREARRDHEQRAHPAARRLAHDAQHLGGGHRHHRELRRLGEVAQRARGARRGHDAAVGMHRDGDAGEAAAHDVAEDGAADAVLAVRGADDRDRGGREQRSQRGHRGDVRAVGLALLEARGRRAGRATRWTSPYSVWRRVSKPAPAKTPSIARLPAITSASKRVIARAAAISASCSSSRVARPRPCISSATAKATSAAPGSLRRS